MSFERMTVDQFDDVLVLRDDLYPGGTKARMLPAMIHSKSELVFGGPFCGGAPVALSVIGARLHIPVTLFYAERKSWHPRQLLCQSYGARLVAVPIGRMSKVQKAAREYAHENGARFFPLGYDLPEARLLLRRYMKKVREVVGTLDYLFLSMGTGMLASCAAEEWPEARIVATAVGLKSRWSEQKFPLNLEVIEWHTGLDTPAKGAAPFPCDPYYDLKAWQTLQAYKPKGRVLFWNVLGEPEVLNDWG